MVEFDNRNSFVLFRNKSKPKPTSPDFSGTFTDDDGREFFLDAWSKDMKSGDKFLSGKKGNLKTKQSRPATVEPRNEMSDDVPF